MSSIGIFGAAPLKEMAPEIEPAVLLSTTAVGCCGVVPGADPDGFCVWSQPARISARSNIRINSKFLIVRPITESPDRQILPKPDDQCRNLQVLYDFICELAGA